MAISPYIDRSRNDLNARRNVNNDAAVKTQASSDLFRHAQGVSLKTYRDTKCRMLPLISANGYPQGRQQVINHQMEQTSFGDVLLFETAGQTEGFYPFEDISSGRDPVSFIRDPGITAYPQVILNPNYLDPGQMNGIIEPLSVRGTIAGASIDSPFVARTIKASLMDSPISYVRTDIDYKMNYDLTPRFIDSQDTRMTSGKFNLAIPGISDFGTMPTSPYDDSYTALHIVNDLMTQSETLFNDFIGVGIISKMVMNTMFDFERNKSVLRGRTGIRNVTNVDSLAFGGFLR